MATPTLRRGKFFGHIRAGNMKMTTNGMMVTSCMIDIFRQTIQSGPLGQDEMRRVNGMGALFISRVEPGRQETGYIWLYSIRIDGCRYCFYST